MRLYFFPLSLSLLCLGFLKKTKILILKSEYASFQNNLIFPPKKQVSTFQKKQISKKKMPPPPSAANKFGNSSPSSSNNNSSPMALRKQQEEQERLKKEQEAKEKAEREEKERKDKEEAERLAAAEHAEAERKAAELERQRQHDEEEAAAAAASLAAQQQHHDENNQQHENNNNNNGDHDENNNQNGGGHHEDEEDDGGDQNHQQQQQRIPDPDDQLQPGLRRLLQTIQPLGPTFAAILAGHFKIPWSSGRNGTMRPSPPPFDPLAQPSVKRALRLKGEAAMALHAIAITRANSIVVVSANGFVDEQYSFGEMRKINLVRASSRGGPCVLIVDLADPRRLRQALHGLLRAAHGHGVERPRGAGGEELVPRHPRRDQRRAAAGADAGPAHAHRPHEAGRAGARQADPAPQRGHGAPAAAAAAEHRALGGGEVVC